MFDSDPLISPCCLSGVEAFGIAWVKEYGSQIVEIYQSNVVCKANLLNKLANKI